MKPTRNGHRPTSVNKHSVGVQRIIDNFRKLHQEQEELVGEDLNNWQPAPNSDNLNAAGSEYEIITPAKAKTYLAAYNELNRPIMQKEVDRLILIIKEGRWEPDIPIIFDTNGELIDGQHRLAAIMQSNQSVKVLVQRNTSPNVRQFIDTGRRRTLLDVCTIHANNAERNEGRDVKVAGKYESATLRYMFIGARFTPVDNNPNRPKRLSEQYRLATLDDKLPAHHVIELFNKHYEHINFAASYAKSIKNAAIYAVFARAHYQATVCEAHDLRDIEEFICFIKAGTKEFDSSKYEPKFQVVAALNKKIDKERGYYSRFKSIDMYRFTEYALQAFLTGRVSSRVYLADTEHFPFPDFD